MYTNTPFPHFNVCSVFLFAYRSAHQITSNTANSICNYAIRVIYKCETKVQKYCLLSLGDVVDIIIIVFIHTSVILTITDSFSVLVVTMCNYLFL